MTYDSLTPAAGLELLYQQLFDALPTSSLLLQANAPNYTIVAVTPQHLKYSGLQKEEVVGKRLFDAFPSNSEDANDTGESNLKASLEHVIQKKEPHQLPVQRYDVADDKGQFIERFWRLESRPVFAPDGSIAFIIHTSEDITEQAKAGEREEAHVELRNAYRKIEESEAKFRSLIEEAPVATCLFVSREMVIEVANDAMIQVWGKGRKVIGLPLAEALPELKGQHFLPLLDELFNTGNTFSAKGGRADLVVDGQLQTFYFDYDFKPLRTAEGTIYAILETAVDVTERELSRKKIEESEQNLRNMILQAPVAMCIFRGKEFIIEIANEKMFEFWGKPSQTVMGKPLFEALPEAKNQGYEELMLNVLNTGNAFAAKELPVTLPRHGETQTVYINFAYEPLRELDGTISGIMALATDVTEQVMARQKIEEVVVQRTRELATANETLSSLNKELQRSNQNLEEFAHAASHDLKEPVRKIHFFTNQLRDQLKDHAKESEVRLFSRIENATKRMGNLIDDLLLYSHVSHRPHQTESVDLNEKIERVLEDLELDIEDKKATINVGQLPILKGYGRQLQQLFQNLISNAIKYSRAEVPPVIDITADEVEKSGSRLYLISVKDNGIGFDPVYADKIFQMFARLHGKAEYSGTGIGLSIVKKVVENHHGLIEVESVVKEGSVFKIYLPV